MEQKEAPKQPKISKRQQKKFQQESDNQDLTPEEIKLAQQKIFESLKAPCKGCSQKEGLYTLRKMLLCESCFKGKIYTRTYQYLRGKVPALGSKLLIAIVGEENSKFGVKNRQKLAADFLVMQRVLGKARSEKKILNEAEILYVDLGCVESRNLVQQWSQEFNVKVNPVFIQDTFQGDFEKMKGFLKLFKDQDEILKILKYNIIMEKSLEMGFSNVFLNECGQSVAQQTFSSLSQGRGLNVLQEIEAVSNIEFKGQNMTIFRILKELVQSEIEDYYKIVRKPTQVMEEQKTEESLQDLNLQEQVKKPTVGNILDNFFEKLQTSFPSTVHTALRSFDKVVEKFDNPSTPCFICLGKLDKIVNQLELDTYEELGKSEVQNIQGLCFGCMRMLKNSNSSPEVILGSLPEVFQINRQKFGYLQ